MIYSLRKPLSADQRSTRLACLRATKPGRLSHTFTRLPGPDGFLNVYNLDVTPRAATRSYPSGPGRHHRYGVPIRGSLIEGLRWKADL
jgi:hypothetical protein